MTTASKMKSSKKGKKVGKRRSASEGKPKTPREKFAAHLRMLAENKTAVSIAESMGVTTDAVLKWLRGVNTPDLDLWPKLAKALDLDDWRKLLPPL